MISHCMIFSGLNYQGEGGRREMGVVRVGTLRGGGEREDGKWYSQGNRNHYAPLHYILQL